MKIHVLARLTVMAMMVAGCAKAQDTSWRSPPLVQSCTAVTDQTCALAASLGRGINMGNMLEAPREGDAGLRLENAYLDRTAEVFKTVRIPIRWSNHAAATADATLDEAFAARIDAVVDYALGKGLNVIINMHHYSQVFGDPLQPNEFEVDPAVVDERLVNLWRQIALRYRDKSPKLIFELLNEPHGRMSGDTWNAMAASALAAVRESNPDRAVLIGPSYYNNVRDLSILRLPPDRNLIVAIHNYEPFNFTHQGASWIPMNFPTGVTCCNWTQLKTISDSLDVAVKWNRDNGYPVHLGEFGSYRAADMASREKYARAVRDAAERRGINWTYWDFGGTFAIYDIANNGWIEPLKKALVN